MVNSAFELAEATTPILHDLNLEIPAGQITVVIGPSGSGKSSLLRLLNRLDIASSGTVSFQGVDVTGIEPRTLRRDVGMVFQRPTVFDGTCAENLRVGDPDLTDAGLVTLFERVGLDPELIQRDARTLSGGEAQRLCLARTLATTPSVLLLDEPTSALDSDSVHVIEHFVRSFVDDGGTAVWVSHDRAQVKRMADHLVQVVDGTIADSGAHDAMGHVHDDDNLWLDSTGTAPFTNTPPSDPPAEGPAT